MPGALGIGLFLIFRYFTLPNRVKKIFKQQKTLQVPATVEVHETGFESENSYGSSRGEWSDFVGYKENKDYFIIYQSDVMYNIIPKRAFNDSEELEEFRKILTNEVKIFKPKFRVVWIFVLLILAMVIISMLYQFR
jgi:hypothetical protein